MDNFKIILVGVGSGKIYCLIYEMVGFLKLGVCFSGIIVIIFIKKVVVELQEWVCVSLLEEGMIEVVDEFINVLIGMVYGFGVKLLWCFVFEVGVFLQVDIIVDEDYQVMFNQFLVIVLIEEWV